jgi:signal transduction histidine kinase
MWNTLLAGRVWSGELYNRRKDGTEYVEEQTITPVKDAAGHVTHFVTIKRDITQRRLLEQQASQSQRIEGIGRLAGGVAHDFNNLLTVINGTVEMMMTRAREDAAMLQDLQTVRDAAQRGAKLTKQLLAFSRQQVLQPTVLDVNGSVQEMHALLSRLIGEHITMRLDLLTDVARIRADAGQLGQVLMNLVVNARDAMPDGGTIGIRTDVVAVEEHSRGPDLAMPPGDYVTITVTDTGIGMDEATREKIFEPFFTTKAAGKGTGLGLPTAYGIVKQSGGFIWVESAPGKGTTFHLAFPAVDEPIRERSSGPTLRATLDDLPIVTATILLVEDEDAIRMVANRVLTSRGYTVIAAASGDDALTQAAGQHVDLLLTDMVMPGMSGPELAQRLRAERPDLKVLFTSGYSRDAVSQDFGMSDAAFIAKPYGLKELVAAVRGALES